MKYWINRLSNYEEYPSTDTAKYCYYQISKHIDDGRMRSFYNWMHSMVII